MRERRTRPRTGPWLAGFMCLVLAACGTVKDAHLVPDEPGLYAVVDEDNLTRLDGDREWEVETWEKRSSFDGLSQFVIYDPALGNVAMPLDQVVGIYRVAWVRSRISAEGEVFPNEDRTWKAPENSTFGIPVRVRRLEGHADKVEVVPEESLSNGLYSLQFDAPSGQNQARFGIGWQSIDRDQYAGRNCVDEYLDEAGRLSGFRLCTEQQLQTTGGLRVYLVKPRIETLDNGRRLVVQGVVVNTSDRARTVPALNAAAQSGDGVIIGKWTFTIDPSRLKPGDSVSFVTALENPPDDVKTVNVTFTQNVAAAGNP